MKKLFPLFFLALLSISAHRPDAKGFISIFDGKSFDGWKVGKNKESFKIEDGAIVVNGQVGHLYYDGPIMAHQFSNFELKLDIMTTPGSNSGSISIRPIWKKAGRKKVMKCR